MQKRHTDRDRYFNELAETSRKYYVSYVSQYKKTDTSTCVLEVGCGDGGNLVPFAQAGCRVTGMDMAAGRIETAQENFKRLGCEGTFFSGNFLELEAPNAEEDKYDLILLHDVIEHITAKAEFLKHIKRFLKADGIFFVGFPAWQMPFGGHQQICRSWLCSHMPFFHLLPRPVYKSMLSMCGEKDNTINELLDIKKCGTSIELFERLINECGYKVKNRTFWFINPHYEQKFGLRPRLLYKWLGKIRYVRNYFTTSSFYILTP